MATNIVMWEGELRIEAQSPSGQVDSQRIVIPLTGGTGKVSSRDFPDKVAASVAKAFAVFEFDEEMEELNESNRLLGEDVDVLSARNDDLRAELAAAREENAKHKDRPPPSPPQAEPKKKSKG